jgi:methionyl aminopeptidase
MLTVGADPSTHTKIACVNPPKPAAASGLIQGVLEGQDEDGDDDEDEKTGADMKSGSEPSNGELKYTQRISKADDTRHKEETKAY